MKLFLPFFFLTLHFPFAEAKSNVGLLRVFKNERRLELLNSDRQIIKSYKIMLGRNPIGAKTREGDNKTPEGIYILDYKNPASSFHKALHISYPNKAQILNAKKQNISPGGDIMLHGLPNNFKKMTTWLEGAGLGELGDELIRKALPFFDWTNGCIAVTDSEIDEIYKMVDVPTTIEIFP